MIRLLYAEPNARERLAAQQAALIVPGIEVVGLAKDGREAAELAVALQPDVIALSERLEVMDGFKTAQLLHCLLPKARLLLLADEPTPETLFRALTSGVWKCLFQPVSLGALFEEVWSAGHAVNPLSNGSPVVAASPSEASFSSRTPHLPPAEPEPIASPLSLLIQMGPPQPLTPEPYSRRLRRARDFKWAPLSLSAVGFLALLPFFEAPNTSQPAPSAWNGFPTMRSAHAAGQEAAGPPLPSLMERLRGNIALEAAQPPSARRLYANRLRSGFPRMVASAAPPEGAAGLLDSWSAASSAMAPRSAKAGDQRSPRLQLAANTPGRAQAFTAAARTDLPGRSARSFNVLILQPTQTSILEFNTLDKVVIANPAVADVTPVTSRDLVVLAKAPGETTLYAWDHSGRHTYRVVVEAPAAGTNPQDVAERLRTALGNDRIKVSTLEDALILEGTVGSAAEAKRAETMAAILSPNVRNLLQVEAAPTAAPPSDDYARQLNETLATPGVTVRATGPSTLVVSGRVPEADADRIRRILASTDKSVTVVDGLTVANRPLQQVQLRARVVDINRTKLKNLGVNWGQVNEENSGTGKKIFLTDQPFLFGLSNSSFSRLLPIGARLNALVQENAARILSEPNMLVLEGSEGSLLVGGEFPIPILQSTTGGGAVTVTYKPFGVSLKMKPSVVEGDEVTMQIAPEVSLLDFTNAVTLNGTTLPSLRTRREDTTIRMRAGQTLAIGGLIENNYSKTVSRIPLISKIPILGELFKSKSWSRNESELVILITPEIVAPGETPTVNTLDRESSGLTIQRPLVPKEVWPGGTTGKGDKP